MTDAGTLVAVKPPEDAAAVDTIGMHRYYLEDEAKENEAEEGTKVDLGHLEDDDTDGTSKSLYRIYGFCGILPPQTWNDGTPMLRLYVNDPITGKEKTYVYIPDATNGLKIEGGRISVLKLKLSRTADDMLVVMGNVEDWDPATGDVYVTEDQD